MKSKLARLCSDNDLIDDLIETLVREGLQSDARFVESFVQQRVGKGHGPLRIRQELRQRGIADDLIDSAITDVTTDWPDLAEQVRAKKFGADLPGDFQTKAKQSRFLYSRGFSSEHINQVLKSSQ